MWGWDISWDEAGCPVFSISPLGNKLENLPESISGDGGKSGLSSHSLVCKDTQLYLGQGWIHSASPLAEASQVSDPSGRGQACAWERGTGLEQDWFSSEQHIACIPAAVIHVSVPRTGWK